MFRRIIALIGFFCVLVLLHAQQPNKSGKTEIKILTPRPEEHVDVRANVSGKISGVREDAQLYVLVRALSWSGWWVQPLPVVSDGTWESNCYFGTPDQGRNERYAVMAVLLPKRDGMKEGGQLGTIPDSIAASEIVTVVRK